MNASNPTVVEKVRTRLITHDRDASPANVAEALRAEGMILSDESLIAMVEELRRELHGAGPLEKWLRLPEVTDLVVNGPRDVFIDRGAGLERVHCDLGDEERVRGLAQRMAARAGKRLDDASPYVDARLPDGSRMHGVLAPIASDHTCISIRIPRRKAFSLEELLERDMLTMRQADIVQEAVAQGANCVVSGGTGTGKTTFLNTVIGLVPANERLVVVEDSAELTPSHPHVVRLQARIPNAEGVGQITMRDLVRQTLRMRPDRIVVGEVRGVEVVDLLSALNTGHRGSFTTVHANSPNDVPARFEVLGLMAGMDRRAVHALVAGALAYVIHIERTDRRRVSGIHRVVTTADGWVRTESYA